VTDISIARRIGIAATATFACGAIFHSQLSIALVTRGDTALASGGVSRATAYYERALRLDPSSKVAADRLAFCTFETHSEASLLRAAAVASAALREHPGDADLLVDRALSFQALHRFGEATADFERAATATHDRRYAIFAAWDARRAGDTRRARRLWKFASSLGVPASLSPFSRGVRS